MKIGVIGSGSIGPDLAYGFISSIASSGGKVTLQDIREEALEAGLGRIRAYVAKGLGRGKLSPKAAKAIEAGLKTSTNIRDLADCDYVLEAATEELSLKQKILADLENVVRPDCLIGFATSGIPRSQIASDARHPERCFVNHPFFPAWRATPVEVVLSEDEALGQRMLETLSSLGKVPIITSDVPCFAADDIFCNYCSEAARIFAEGKASVEQVDAIVNGAIGGGGPFLVMDLTRGNLLNVKCQNLMKEAETGSDWFAPPPIFSEQANTPWHDRKNPGPSDYDKALEREVLDRILAVLMARTFFVFDREICHPRELNWLTRNALGFSKGLLDLAEEMGMEKVHEICTAYAKNNPGFELSESILEKRRPLFARNVETRLEGEIAELVIRRPEAMNALNERTLQELDAELDLLEKDDSVKGVVLTSFGGSLAGADILELAALETAEEARAKCLSGQKVLLRIAAFPKPVVAALDGPVLGGGAEISMACHARVVGRKLMLGQPEVNLGIIPGYGGTQRLPRLIGLERSLDLLRTGRPVGAKEACLWGWAEGEAVDDPVAGARKLIAQGLAGERALQALDSSPMELPNEFPALDIGHHSLAVDALLVKVLREGLSLPLEEGILVEADGFATCRRLVDYDVGMNNFLQNGPRVPAVFMNE
ncbi:MAG: 3-hydroxyacyl-CoA dehydrogenase NAD-binding domain-containing protein [Candidatus Krumholzibacteria bacterium]|nr:3-hydroxyacyl-CoA dehydrogenase NAD-binding domain-containing protein [Candidatus Krumholzibacteria bacterium]